MRPFSTPLRWLGVMALAACVATPALAQRTVTLRMNSATMPDTVAAGPAADVQVRGQLGSGTVLPGGGTIDWNDDTTLRPANDGGDYWSIDFQIPENDELNFKFYIGQSEADSDDPSTSALPGGWEDGDNVNIPAGTGDVALDLHYFNKTGGGQAYDWRPFAAEGDSVAVWFRVYMDTENAALKKYTPDDGNLVVSLRGNFGERNGFGSEGAMVDWDGTDARLTRERATPGTPGYSLFSGLVRFPASEAGNTVNYKFYFNDSDVMGDGGYEDGGNRTFDIPMASSDTTLHWQFFSNSPANTGTLVTANTIFQVDVSPLSSIGLFQTSDDFVQVRGAFNGWGCDVDGNSDNCLLQQEPGTADFLRQIPITSAPGGDPIFYKYYISLNNPDGSPFFTNDDGTENFDAGYEEPLDYGGGNRPFLFTGVDQTLDEAFFNSVRPGNLIADGQSVDVTFTADMNNALSFVESQGRAFNPATDSVTVQFEDSFWLLTQGLTPGSDDLIQGAGGSLIPGFKLTDPDGDNVYTGTLTVEGPTYNAIAYRLAFGSDADGLRVEGQSSLGEAGRRRYRYVTDVTVSTFAFGRDTFRPSNSSTPWEINPTGPFTPGEIPFSAANGFNDTGNAVSTPTGPASGELALGNVYPNPTTGAARVVVSGRADARVSVRVYDVTGRVVATVAEDVAIDGRPLEFDVSGLASGLYLVRADSESGVATQRLTVVR